MGETLQGIAKLSFVNAIYLVSHPSFMEKTHEVALQENLEKIKAIIPGGNSREESVYEAMKYLSTTTIDPDDVVMICDGDRPYIEERIFSENVDTARAVGGAVTALPASDSIFYSRNGYYADSYLPRKQIYRAQTPQSFLFEFQFDLIQLQQAFILFQYCILRLLQNFNQHVLCQAFQGEYNGKSSQKLRKHSERSQIIQGNF